MVQFVILLAHVGHVPELKYLPDLHVVHVFAVWEQAVHPVIVEQAAHEAPFG